MAWVQNQTLKSHARAPELYAPKQAVKNDAVLSFYEELPSDEIGIHEFETFALDRLRVLKGVEHARSQGKRDAELDVLTKQLCQKHLKGVDARATQLKDAVSHFILRLAFCRTEEHRRWLLAQECELFKHRFKLQTPEEQGAFMQASELPYVQLSDEEQTALAPQLDLICRSAMGTSLAALRQASKTGRVDFFRVPFEQVPDLVATRRVLLVRGSALVPKDFLASVLVAAFRERLQKGLVICAGRCAAAVDASESDRLAPIIASLSTRHITQDIQGPAAAHGAGERVTLAQLPGLAQRHFPLCMQQLYFNLLSDHHLRHAGRQQLGLFLKRAGLSLDESMTFFRHAMAQRTPGEKFDKEYAYNIRHMYGKEGRRKDYEAHSCMKVIAGVPGVGEYHGCPFKTLPESGLRAALARMAVPAEMANEAVEKARNQHYQVACARVYEGVFGEAPDAGVTHPNAYLAESLAVVAAAAKDAAAPAAPGASPSAPTPGPHPRTPGSLGTPHSTLTPSSAGTTGYGGWARTPLQPTPPTFGPGGGATPGAAPASATPGRTTPATADVSNSPAMTPATLAPR